VKPGLAQLNSRQNKAVNLAAAGEAIDRLARQGADLVLLPESFNFHGLDEANAGSAEPIPGPSSDWAAAKAKEHGIYLHCGSLMESRGDKVYNTSLVFDRNGAEVARYSKMHLFDAKLPDGLDYFESEFITPGNEVVTCECDGITFGLAICYDIRFPQLFYALADRGAHVLLVVAAFTVATGISQWEPILRARAIENGCYVAAAGQWGRYARGRENFGHSMVVDPWGVVIAQCGERVDTLTVEIDMEHLHAVRERLPVQRHRRRDLFG
jgi:deaminated glutathione amidase